MKDNNTWKFSLKRGPEWGEERRERKWKEGGTSEKEQGRKVCQRSTNSSLNKRKKNLLKKNAKILLLLCKSWWNNSLSRWWTLSGEWHLTFTLSEGSIQTSQTLMQPLPSTGNQSPPPRAPNRKCWFQEAKVPQTSTGNQTDITQSYPSE